MIYFIVGMIASFIIGLCIGKKTKSSSQSNKVNKDKPPENIHERIEISQNKN